MRRASHSSRAGSIAWSRLSGRPRSSSPIRRPNPELRHRRRLIRPG
jgi:hypothetical protein